MAMTFLLGGARSGKSSMAVRLASADPIAPVTFVATAEALDDEMTIRIARHQAERPAEWTTLEAHRDLLGILARVAPGTTLIVDCLSMWVANLVMDERSDVELQAVEIAQSIATRVGRTIVVSNEVGLGLVPETPLGRNFRDVLGRVNATFAAASSAAYFIVAGRALALNELPSY
jgi:adenosylcobinamide kinase / adenosylcobinamide-phosphate guanylyltransferase